MKHDKDITSSQKYIFTFGFDECEQCQQSIKVVDATFPHGSTHRQSALKHSVGIVLALGRSPCVPSGTRDAGGEAQTHTDRPTDQPVVNASATRDDLRCYKLLEEANKQRRWLVGGVCMYTYMERL